jgi:hypothetical protein
MEKTLIEFDENESNDSKETIWTIENNEKLQLASFIERQILTKVQLLFDEKDTQIKELRKTNTYLHTEIDDLKERLLILENLIYAGFGDIKVQLQDLTDHVVDVTDVMEKITNEVLITTKDVINVTKDVKKHTDYLSNSYIYLLTNGARCGVPDVIFKANVKKINFQGSINGESIDTILWDLIEYFTELEKLILVHNRIITQNGNGISIFKKIKSKTVKELVISHLGYMPDNNHLYIHDYIEDILTNIPNLEILEINYRPDLCRCPTWINNFVEKITSIFHKLQKIKLTINGIGTIGDLTRIQIYCKMKHIELEIA